MLEPFAPYIQERLAAGVWNVRVLLQELESRGYQGKYTILSDYIRPFRSAARSVAVRRFETPPGYQAQVDWGTLGDIVVSGGQRFVLSGFVMTLGFSRAMFLDIAKDQTLSTRNIHDACESFAPCDRAGVFVNNPDSTLLTMHERAFFALGGVPQQILYDNMKTVLEEYDARGEPVFHPVFLDFTRHYGYTARMCRPYRPQTKGKVESGIGYVKKNFLCGRTASDFEDLRAQAYAWTQTANCRVHGTTGRVVAEAWAQEKPHLLSTTGHTPFVYLPEEGRRVSRDAFISYGGNLYSVPWPHALQEVTVSTHSGQLVVSRDGRCIAQHALCAGKHQTVLVEMHVEMHHEGIPLGASWRFLSSWL